MTFKRIMRKYAKNKRVDFSDTDTDKEFTKRLKDERAKGLILKNYIGNYDL